MGIFGPKTGMSMSYYDCSKRHLRRREETRLYKQLSASMASWVLKVYFDTVLIGGIPTGGEKAIRTWNGA